MATYYHGVPEIQPDGLQTLYLMNPGYVGYSDSPAPANMVLLNSTANMLNPMSQLNQQQHLVGIPIQPSAPSQDLNRSSSIHGSSQELSAIHGLVPPRHHYNLSTPTPSNNSMDLSSLLGLHRPSPVPSAQQGLSLSLSPHQPQFGGYRPQPEIPASMAGAEEVRVPVISTSASAVSNGVSGVQQSVFMGSKYLKVAQQLLDEVVYVGKPAKGTDSKNRVKPNIDEEHTDAGDAKRGVELTTAERQELQMKKAKLVRVLDEVEQRYRQYHQQMQIVVSSFEAAAGFGSARTYTALALQTISKQFRCLRDAISGQIRATSKSLGEEDCLGVTKSHDSRLRFVDHHLRQQRALQQLGMIQHNAWRPQRGLPERAVSVLRAWLFEHFLHPYPKDSDKLMLAKQTGLTRSQVSNWFINARVRLWKPMVEEMYMEETKEQEQSNLGEKTSKSDANEDSTSKSSARQESSPTGTEQTHPRLPPIAVTNNGSYDNDDETLLRPKTKKARSSDSLHLRTMNHSMTTNGELKSNGRNNQEILMNFANNGGGFGGYSIGEIGRFDHQQFTPRLSGNGVSLTLGLPHCESLSLSGAQPSYISSERIQMSSEGNDYCSSSLNNIPPVSHPSNAYEDHINIQRRKRFAAQLLPDFVA